jgi:hypothetical protein
MRPFARLRDLTGALLALAGAPLALATSCSRTSPTLDALDFDAGPALADDAAPASRDAPAGGPCEDPASKLVYVIVSAISDVTGDPFYTLYGFDPAASRFDAIGRVRCPGPAGTPYSMAIDREGVAYVDYTGGTLYRVDTRTAECTMTGFYAPPNGFVTFEGAFVADDGDGGETLFASGDNSDSVMRDTVLGTIDTRTLLWTPVGEYHPPLGFGSGRYVYAMTGTGDGRLFALVYGSIAQIDPRTARVLGFDDLPITGDPPVSPTRALAFWKGDFFVFPAYDSTVYRFTPSSDALTPVPTNLDLADSNRTVTVAASSPCAPL